MGKYDDIIGLPHHVSDRRAPMSRMDRAAQFAPFAALTGYEDAVAETARLTEQRVELDENRRAELDQRIRLLAEKLSLQPEVTVTYFEPDQRKSGGAYLCVTGQVWKVDPYTQALFLTDGTEIPFGEIIGLDGGIF